MNKSDLQLMKDKLKTKTAVKVTRKEFEEIKQILKEIILKLKTRNF